ncbi:hypothetical protein TSUD_99020 [Trifolium subterraneum]|uniref:Myb-like domain-containing protein n=1 Tax=Trifolium subterraneum TaxID=3900 RepID=A0A2Z6NUT2_TRISU|nr:hypothetical protein TSUD_99020 [Trifolium subterraneum]
MRTILETPNAQNSQDNWSENELDTLWIAVRKYGIENWEAVLRDPSMQILRSKTAEGLAIRWEKEALKIFPPPPPILSVLSNNFQGSSSARVNSSSARRSANTPEIGRPLSRMMLIGRKEMKTTTETNVEVVGTDDIGSSMENPIEIDD